MSLVYQTIRIYTDYKSNITVVGVSFLLVSALINAIGKKIIRYIDAFLLNMIRVLNNNQLDEEENGLSLISVDILSDICCTFGDSIFPYANKCMNS
jgi:hypothetical protein